MNTQQHSYLSPEENIDDLLDDLATNPGSGHADGPNGTTDADIRPMGDHSHNGEGTTSAASNADSGSVGSNASFDNRTAYYVLAYIIKL